jgi:hypothetical protein
MTTTPTHGIPVTARSPAGWSLEQHAHGRLVFVDADGRRHDDVDVLRAFPVSAPAGPVAIVTADGGELAWIDPLAGVDPPLRRIIETAIAQREFLPTILRIEAVSDGEPAEWLVATDRGPHRFKIAHADDIARQPDGGAFLTDIFGVRYRIPSVAGLDAASRRLFEKML